MPSCTNTTPTTVAPPAKGLLRPELTAQAARIERGLPVSVELESFVERYWAVEWDRPRDQAPFRAEVLDHPCVNFTIESGEAPRYGVTMPAALLHGPVTGRFAVDLSGRGRVFGVKFRPGGFTALCGGRVERDEVRRLGGELGAAATALTDDVLADTGDHDRAVRMDVFLRERAGSADQNYLDLLDLLDAMRDDSTLVRVAGVAQRAGVSTRQLQRRFDQYLALTPKWVLRRYRIHDAVDRIDAGEVTDLASLAAELGWFDQAHFSREFRATVGVTPGDYLSRHTVPGSSASTWR